jgi:simple sugar transport system ATP-binding protein
VTAAGTTAPGGRWAVEAIGITKRYGELVANDDVTLRLRPGEVHALCGENGAGKSTLVGILYGETPADRGEIRVREQLVEDPSPARAISLGLGMVHQHFMLVPSFTVVENVVLGREPLRRGLVDLAGAAVEISALCDRFGLGVDPLARAGELSVGEAQRLEILKVLWRGADILLLDEPTAVLVPAEVRELLRVVRSLADAGKTCLFISHKLDEVMALCDRVTVLARGRAVAEFSASETTAAEIARAMVGRDVALPRRQVGGAPPGEAVVTVRDLRCGRALRGVSFDVRRGEILGVAGVQGNGQHELVLALAGLLAADGGVVRSPPAAHIPEDRHARGLVLDFSLEDNLVLGRHREIWGARAVREGARRALAEYDIRPPRPFAPARSFSGGNQQKIVVARELGRGARVLLAAHPTRGVDLGAIELIHRRLLDARQGGCAVLLVSSELSELRALCDRIAVIHRGRLVKTFDGASATEEELGLAMTGAGDEPPLEQPA